VAEHLRIPAKLGLGLGYPPAFLDAIVIEIGENGM
jgi:hypothetical protein